MPSVDYKLDFDNEASGPFTEGELLTFGGGGVAELVILRDNGTTGSMYFSLISGSAPANDETITGGTSSATANVNGTPFISRFPLKIRDDISKNIGGDIRWTGPALGTTHSCKYDAESGGPFTVNEILTFGGGQTGELIALTDDGATGELFIRMISGSFDLVTGDLVLPDDNDTITGGTSSATAAVDGAFHTRAYTPNNIHYWFLDLADDAVFTGNDVQDRTLPEVSQRVGVTDVNFQGTSNVDDALIYHLYGGSIQQSTGDDEYNAMDIEVVDADGETQPVLIQNNALLSATTTEYWKNAYMPNAARKVRILVKVKSGGTVIDRRVVRTRALEYGRNYFTASDATLSSGITPISLVATNDGNNNTAAGTVASYTGSFTFGLQTVDHNNGNGAQPYWAVGDRDGDPPIQLYEKSKYDQRRGTSATIYGLNYQLFLGNDLDIPYDNEASGPFTEGNTVTWSGGSALILALDDNGATGVLYCQKLTGTVPLDNTALTEGSVTADVNGTPTTRVIINNWVGSFTGSAFNPANRGVTLQAADAVTSDLYTDLLDGQQSPPNNQSGTTNASPGDTVTMHPWDGSTLDSVGNAQSDFDILTLATALTGASEVAVVVNESIPSWVPSSGEFRVTTNGGVRRLLSYSSYSGQTFSIASTDFSGDNASVSNGVMPIGFDGVPANGTASFTGVFTTPQSFAIVVRNGSSATPKRPSYNTAVFGSGGFSLNVTLQDD